MSNKPEKLHKKIVVVTMLDGTICDLQSNSFGASKKDKTLLSFLAQRRALSDSIAMGSGSHYILDIYIQPYRQIKERIVTLFNAKLR